MSAAEASRVDELEPDAAVFEDDRREGDHATRAGVRKCTVYRTECDASLGFIAVAVSTLVGSVPAGWLGARYGRRRMSLVGPAGMTMACVVLHVVPTLSAAIAVLFLFGLSWSIPVANLAPMALELTSVARIDGHYSFGELGPPCMR